MSQLQRKLYYILSPNMRLVVRKAFYFPIDIWEALTVTKHKYEPSKGDIYIGSGDFIKQGIHHLELLKHYLKLKPQDAILDVGSGIGRTAVALTEYMTVKGRYEGFDVVEKGVKWCNSKIKKDFPNFNFIYVSLNNDLYNDNKIKAENFKFPYPDNFFDKVFLFSVFTHLSVKETANYLCEIKRVLKPEGLCLSTFFIYSAKNEKMIANNNHFSFPYNKGDYRLMSTIVKSANIALKETLLDELIIQAELEKLNTIEGFWKKDILNHKENDYQDIVILKA